MCKNMHRLLMHVCSNIIHCCLSTYQASCLQCVLLCCMMCLDFAANAGCHLCGVCTIPGWQGGLALLSNLERSPMARVLLRGLPAQGGFEAAYFGGSCCPLLTSLLIALAASLESFLSPLELLCRYAKGRPLRVVSCTNHCVIPAHSALMLPAWCMQAHIGMEAQQLW